jgi:hypothetical protein
MPAFEWHECIAKITPYVFQISTPDGSGTGWLLRNSASGTLCSVVTAAHVIDHAHYWEEPIRLTHTVSGESILLRPSDRAISVDHTADTAALVFNRGTLTLPNDPLPLFEKGYTLKSGVEIGWLGFPSVARSTMCFFSGHVSACLDGESSYLVDGVAINGVSGGPAFRRVIDATELVGLVSAYIPNRATGDVLPGVALIRDVEKLHDVVERFNSFDQAKTAETKPTEPPPPPQPSTEPDAGAKTSKKVG